MISRVCQAAVVLIATGNLHAQNFDAGSNTRLNGSYYVRMVAFSGVRSDGFIARARSVYGVINFNGAGLYTIDGQIADNATAPILVSRFSSAGTYSVGSTGMAELQNPLDGAQTIRAAVGDTAVVGSTTEADIHDIFIAVPAGPAISTDALEGTWRTGYLDFPDGKSTLARTAFFSMALDGQGGLGDVPVSGNSVVMGALSHTVAGASYWVNPNGSGGLRFPLASTGQLLAGDKVVYTSADRNILIGGSANGFDMLVAVRGVSAATNATYKGTYFITGARVDPFELSRGVNHFFFYSGSVSANGDYATVWHYRINPAGTPSYDLTRVGGFAIGNDGTMTAPRQRIALGAGGDVFVETGAADDYHFVFGVRTTPTSRDGLWLNPIGILNGAAFTPATNPVAPGEIVSLSGSGFAEGTAAANGAPLPFSLAGVQLLVNGRPAPLMYVSPTRIMAVVPYATKEKFATFRVTRDGTASNSVTMYNNLCSPGVFTMTPGGLGTAAVLHLDLTPVTAGNPARRGETVVFFATGLGQVTPAVADGAPAPASPLSRVVLEKTLFIYIDGKLATTRFGGLAPGFAGVYRVECRIPDNVSSGDVYLDIDADPAGYTSLTTLRIAP